MTGLLCARLVPTPVATVLGGPVLLGQGRPVTCTVATLTKVKANSEVIL